MFDSDMKIYVDTLKKRNKDPEHVRLLRITLRR